MLVSRQSDADSEIERGPKARTGRLMLDTAISLMQGGATPSVSDVAEAAGVSRATAYRYFPSQAALVEAVVDEGLGPILTWKPTSQDAKARVNDLIATGMPRIESFEATFKAALKLSLEQWVKGQSGTLGEEPQFRRGHRVQLLGEALEPLRGTLPPESFDRLAQALSLVFGVEALIVLKDIWGLDGERTQSVVKWVSSALVDAAIREADEVREGREEGS
jgi:AcrR family transcriptional regulator